MGTTALSRELPQSKSAGLLQEKKKDHYKNCKIVKYYFNIIGEHYGHVRDELRFGEKKKKKEIPGSLVWRSSLTR